MFNNSFHFFSFRTIFRKPFVKLVNHFNIQPINIKRFIQSVNMQQIGVVYVFILKRQCFFLFFCNQFLINAGFFCILPKVFCVITVRCIPRLLKSSIMNDFWFFSRFSLAAEMILSLSSDCFVNSATFAV